MDSKHYCSDGYKIRCPEGTRCYGSEDGECPCKRKRPKPDNCDKCDGEDWDKASAQAMGRPAGAAYAAPGCCWVLGAAAGQRQDARGGHNFKLRAGGGALVR